MIRSMWSAVSGLRNHQTYLDVTGNNIANVNTTGYKSTRAVFEDSLSQSVRNASAPADELGGMNPSQVGLGVRLGQISGNFTQGGLQVTNVATDMAIQGDGFFAIKKGDETLYTRSGAFTLDKLGDLVTADGGYVLDDAGAKITIDSAEYTSWKVSPNGAITGFNEASPGGVEIARLGLAKFNNPSGLERVGGSMFRETPNSGDANVLAAGTDGRGLVTAGALEMSNVDLATEFTNLIIAQRGFQANSKVITASDEVLQDLINMKR